ncbi:MAG TPA: thioredoxin domain-containing protein [Solirubrobacteraceae bacterium]|nr:thioredoxin domain-containing protein [Solirubrobacteraceae bacterium]
MNRLAEETSPYLLQHKDNPVDWYPWGEEAFARARAEDKAVLVSIGYSACHWCHVMERESFEDPETARLMNERFVCVKVDREERPDVDAIYMDAVQAMTGHGGWPLNAFITPDGVPFYAGTYFPPEPARGMPSWRQIVIAIADAWRQDREKIVEGAAQILPRLQGAAGIDGREGELDPAALDAAVNGLRSIYDGEHGGFGTAPKFPPASVVEFLLGRGERAMSLHTLRAMANGGMYDQVGGGFSRYSVDARWVVPHFEKMLYDNGLLARAYLHGWQVSGDPLLQRVCVETLEWMLRELRQEEGAFASALDADSEGVEGRYYVWTLEQVREALDGDLADEAIRHFGMTEAGNWEGVNIPVRATADPPRLGEIKAALYEARERRVRPGLDDKRLTSWNALAIAALAEAGAVLGRPDFVDAARTCAAFLLDTMRDDRGRLLRSYNRGRAKIAAYLEDHAYLVEALLVLYEATFEERWFVEARRLADETIARFGDRERGGFFTTSDDHERLVARRKDLEDTPIPSGASSIAYGLLRLAALTGERDYSEHALGVMRPLGEAVGRFPQAFGHLLQAIAFHLEPVREVALVGDDVAPLAAVVRSAHRPHVVLAGGSGPGGAVPLLEGRTPLEGRAAAYVCENFACRRPVTEPAELEALLS